MNIGEKSAYVARQLGIPNGHSCHWPGCHTLVKPALFMCRAHWFKLPHQIRTKVWRTYRPGQERDKRPSPAYMKAAKEALGFAYLDNAKTHDYSRRLRVGGKIIKACSKCGFIQRADGRSSLLCPSYVQIALR